MGHTSGHIPTRGFTGLEDKEEAVAAVMAEVGVELQEQQQTCFIYK